MKKFFSTRIITTAVALSMCCLSSSFVMADSWDEAVEYCIDEEAEAFEIYGEDDTYWAGESESNDCDESYDEEEYYPDDEISDDSEEPDYESDSINELQGEVPDVPVLEETVSGDEDVLSTVEDALLEGENGDVVASGTCGESATWTLTGEENDLTLTISGSGNMDDFSSSYSPWSPQSKEIKTVIIAEGITGIGKYAFFECTSLPSITLPDSVTSIRKGAFWACSKLKSITIPDNVTMIENSVFQYCKSLKSITFPDGLKTIGNSAFYGCASLINLTIPDSVTNIEYYAFYGCSGLTSITLPVNMTSIEKGLLSGCKSLISITLPDSVTDIKESAFSGCSSLTSITLPDSMTSVENGVFGFCESLTSMTLPDSVTSIGDDAFYYCKSLESITIPNSVTSIGKHAFALCGSLKSVTLPDSVTSIGDDAFSYCNSLESITLPDSVTTIGEYAFYSSDLKSVTLSNRLISIEAFAFSGCSSLTSITLPDSVTTIGKYAFSGCSSLKSITVPASVTSIEEYGIEDCVEDRLIIYGKRGSTVEKYAAEYNIIFIDPSRLEYASVSGITSKGYTGKELTQSPVVKLAGKTLKLNTDYYLAYKNNINAGKATLAVKGMGNYKGVSVQYFTINPVSVKNATITGIVSKVYTGSALTQTPVVKIGTKTLKLDTDYYLAYKNNINTGKATIAIKGKGNYNNVAVRYFAINPKPSWIASLSSPKTKQIKITWGKRTQISGYQLEISTNKSFAKPKMQKNVYDPAKLSMTVTVAKANTTYYVRIRSFKKTSDKTYFSTWSAVKTVKTK